MMSVSEFLILFSFIIPMQVIFIYNYGNMTNQKVKKDIKYIFIILITSLFIFLNNYYNLLSLRAYVGILLNIITAILMYKNSFGLTLFYSIIHAVVSLIVELILSIFLMFYVENIEIFNTMLIAKIIFSLILGFITLIIFSNIKIQKFINKIKQIIFNKKNLVIMTIILLIFLDILIIVRATEVKNIYVIFLTINSIIFMIITIRIIINDRYNMIVLNNQSNSIKENIKAYSKTIDDCRELKHNLRNDLLTIKSGLNKDSQDQINEIITKYNNNYEWINKIDEIPEGLQGLIYLKQKESEKKNIKLYVNTIKNIKINNKDYIDLCSVLGILIDNAIYASKNTKSKVIEINFKEIGKDLNIKISNNYNNDIDVNKIGNKNYSTKEYKSGLGLNFIKKINNSNIKVNFKIVNNLFITDILYSMKK